MSFRAGFNRPLLTWTSRLLRNKSPAYQKSNQNYFFWQKKLFYLNQLLSSLISICGSRNRRAVHHRHAFSAYCLDGRCQSECGNIWCLYHFVRITFDRAFLKLSWVHCSENHLLVDHILDNAHYQAVSGQVPSCAPYVSYAQPCIQLLFRPFLLS